jgi:protein-disulfide isomerase
MKSNLVLGVIAIIMAISVVGDSLGFKEQLLLRKRVIKLEKKVDDLSADIKKLTSARVPAQQPEEDFSKVYDIPVGSAAVQGKETAPVTIVMFADYECPFSARFYGPLKDVLKAYPDRIRFVIKNFPLNFHAKAIPAAKAALAAGLHGKYFEMAGLVMDNKADVSGEKLKEYVKAIEIDEKKFFADLAAKDVEFEKQIKDDFNLGINCDVQGTPAFFLNGKKTKARTISSWVGEIDQILVQGNARDKL